MAAEMSHMGDLQFSLLLRKLESLGAINRVQLFVHTCRPSFCPVGEEAERIGRVGA